jgi:hypothetical protein
MVGDSNRLRTGKVTEKASRKRETTCVASSE